MNRAELQAMIDNAVTIVRCREHVVAKWPHNARLRVLLTEARAELQRLTDQQLAQTETTVEN